MSAIPNKMSRHNFCNFLSSVDGPRHRNTQYIRAYENHCSSTGRFSKTARAAARTWQLDKIEQKTDLKHVWCARIQQRRPFRCGISVAAAAAVVGSTTLMLTPRWNTGFLRVRICHSHATHWLSVMRPNDVWTRRVGDLTAARRITLRRALGHERKETASGIHLTHGLCGRHANTP